MSRTPTHRITTHPGEILLEDFLKPFGLSAGKLARGIDVPANRLTEIIRGKRAMTADTAFRLSAYFGTSAELWLNFQVAHDLTRVATEEGAAIRAAIRRDPKVEAHLADLKAKHPDEFQHLDPPLAENAAAE